MNQFPTTLGFCGVIALVTLITINIISKKMWLAKTKPFSMNWFYELIAIIPSDI
jgi:hypothetical protein